MRPRHRRAAAASLHAQRRTRGFLSVGSPRVAPRAIARIDVNALVLPAGIIPIAGYSQRLLHLLGLPQPCRYGVLSPRTRGPEYIKVNEQDVESQKRGGFYWCYLRVTFRPVVPDCFIAV